MFPFTIGNVEAAALVDTTQTYPGADVFPAAGESLDRYRHYLDPEGGLEMNFGCFLLRDPEATILVDTGLGPSEGGRLLAELDEAGVAPGDIDTVLFTHLHGDHTGWSVDPATGKPRFANARHLVPGADWSYYSNQSPQSESFERDVLPLLAAGVMDLFDGERDLGAACSAVPTPGHTPGHTSVMVTSAGERGCILGDVVLSPIDAEELAWANSFDWDDEMARATRLRLVDRLINEGALVGASHLPAPGLGRFVRLDGTTRWEPAAPGGTPS